MGREKDVHDARLVFWGAQGPRSRAVLTLVVCSLEAGGRPDLSREKRDPAERSEPE